MRRDPKPVARGEPFLRIEVGVAERVLSYDLVSMCDRQDTAGLLRRLKLEFNPVADVFDRGLHPWFHVRHVLRPCLKLSRPRRKIQKECG
jgi:hypothetical protein